MQSQIIELGKQRLVAHTRQKVQEHGGGLVTEYSMDGGVTWHPMLLVAYESAKNAGLLRSVGEKPSAGHLEAFVVGLLSEVKTLGVGESLKIVRDQHALYVLRERVVLPCPIEALSDLEDMEFRMEVEDVRGAALQTGASPGGGGGDRGAPGRRDGQEEDVTG